jgi:hypothetical protein
MNRNLTAALTAAALAVVAAGCGGGTASKHTTASATALAHKIPGCSSLITNTPSVLARQDVICTLQDGAQVEIATFAKSGDELRWISDGGSPDSPDPAYAGCCIEGKDWAATVGFNASSGPMDVDYRQVISAVGGREVTG